MTKRQIATNIKRILWGINKVQVLHDKIMNDPKLPRGFKEAHSDMVKDFFDGQCSEVKAFVEEMKQDVRYAIIERKALAKELREDGNK